MKRQRGLEEQIKKMTGMKEDEIKSFAVYIQLNQRFDEEIGSRNEEEMKDMQMGLFKPMKIDQKPYDPYTGKKVKKQSNWTTVK